MVCVRKNIVQANEVFIKRLNREPFNFKLRKITLTCILILYSINCMFFFSLFCFVLFFFFCFILFFTAHARREVEISKELFLRVSARGLHLYKHHAKRDQLQD